jgi:5-oxoprolinase (ATP-hydrolysing) subunit A
MPLLLNCDLGESHEAGEMGLDDQVMPFIDQASIACGFHAGDRRLMKSTLLATKRHKVAAGAHPSYPDIVGFGRRSMKLSAVEIIALVQHQIQLLCDSAQQLDVSVTYVKPHGALYNDMMVNGHIRSAIMQAISQCELPLDLMLQATADAETHRQEAQMFGIQTIFEVFADRKYNDNGTLLARSEPGAVHCHEKILEQVQQLKNHGTVTTVGGHQLTLQADSLCVHGDNSEAVRAVEEIRKLLDQ